MFKSQTYIELIKEWLTVNLIYVIMTDKHPHLPHICPCLAMYLKDENNLDTRGGGGSYHPCRDYFCPPLPRLRYIKLIHIWWTGILPYVIMIDRHPHLRHNSPCLAKYLKDKVNLNSKGGEEGVATTSIYIWLTGTLPYVIMIDRRPHLHHICPCLAKYFKDKVDLNSRGRGGE